MQKIAFLSLKEQGNLYFEAFRHLNEGVKLRLLEIFSYICYTPSSGQHEKLTANKKKI